MWEFLQFLLHHAGMQEVLLCDGFVLPEYFYNLDVKLPYRLSEVLLLLNCWKRD